MKNTVILAGLLLAQSLIAAEQKEPKKVTPIIKDGETQIVAEFKDSDRWIRHDLWVETEFDSDGDGKPDRIHVGVTRPRETESQGLKLPVIMQCSPYFGGKPSKSRDYFWEVQHELGEVPPPRKNIPKMETTNDRPIISKALVNDWLPPGYVVVHVSSPGTGLSQGSPTIGLENESLAPKAVIDWLNGRAKGYSEIDGGEALHAHWTTGKVGMTGVSHPGTFSLAAATTGVEGLEVVIPVAANTSPYHYYRSNGLVRHPLGYLGEDIDYMYDYVHSGNPQRREWSNANVRDLEMAEGLDRLTGDYNEFWAKRDYIHSLDSVKAAVLMAHGLNDWNVVPEHGDRIYQALKDRDENTQVFYHQGGHGGTPPKDMMNRWFAHYLHGADSDIEKGPRAWIVREQDDRSNPTPYDDYPNPAAAPVEFHLIAGAPKQGQLVIDAQSGQGEETLIDNFSFDGSSLAQAEWTEHRLIYVTGELTEAVHLSGTPRISIKLASSKPAANLSVWLVSLPWVKKKDTPITDNIITRGWADPQNHQSLLQKGEPLEPGRFYEMTFDLQPDDQVIPAGQKIGLMILSTDKDFTLWPAPGTEVTIDLDATKITLPVVGGKDAMAKALKKQKTTSEDPK